MQLLDRLEQLRLKIGQSKLEFGRILAGDGRSYARATTDGAARVPAEWMAAAVTRWGADAHWLLTGEGDMMRTTALPVAVPVEELEAVRKDRDYLVRLLREREERAPSLGPEGVSSEARAIDAVLQKLPDDVRTRTLRMVTDILSRARAEAAGAPGSSADSRAPAGAGKQER